MSSDNKRVIVIGSSGQVGRAFVALHGKQCIGLDRTAADMARPETLAAALESYAVSAVVNAAAYTAVDRAETERDLAMTVNGESPGVLARWCAERGIPFVHYSSDYVFPGTGDVPWDELDEPAPLNHYGATKVVGEKAVIEAGGHSLVFRTSWVYDAEGRNFFTTMMRLGRERPSIDVVADQHGAPTYAPHLARATLLALAHASRSTSFPAGVYHVCNAGETTWYEFACEIFAQSRERGVELVVDDVNAIATADYPSPAMRPLNSRLRSDKARAALGVSLPHWHDGLFECMDAYESF